MSASVGLMINVHILTHYADSLVMGLGILRNNHISQRGGLWLLEMPDSGTLSDNITDGILSGYTRWRQLLRTYHWIALVRYKLIGEGNQHLDTTGRHRKTGEQDIETFWEGIGRWRIVINDKIISVSREAYWPQNEGTLEIGSLVVRLLSHCIKCNSRYASHTLQSGVNGSLVVNLLNETLSIQNWWGRNNLDLESRQYILFDCCSRWIEWPWLKRASRCL